MRTKTRKLLIALWLSLTVAQAGATSWSLTGSLNNPRTRFTATLLPNGQVLAAGGDPEFNLPYLSSAELYNPVTAKWTVTGSLITPRCTHTATLLTGGKVLIAGGRPFNSGTLPTSTAELYDPVTGTWSATGSLNISRAVHWAILLPTGKVLVAGGTSDFGNTLLPSAELYDPASGTWTVTGAMNVPRIYFTATLLANGTVLVAGGSDQVGSWLSNAEVYDPTTGTWTLTGSMQSQRVWHTATLLPNGQVLVAGGFNCNNCSALSNAELYDPNAGTWTSTGSMSAPRDQHTATLLQNGNVLVAGGDNANGGSPYASAEVYDPAAGSWSATGSMSVGRTTSHTATLLPCLNQVLVAGGSDGTATLSSAELYGAAQTQPVIACPGDQTVGNSPGLCSSNVTFTVTATDDCGVASIVSSPASGSAFPVGTTTVTSIATDIYGNSSTCSFTVTVIDEEPPNITCPPDIVVSSGTPCAAVSLVANLGTPVVSDNCGVATVSSNPPPSFPVGFNTVPWTATDIHGNSASCYQQVTVTADKSIPANFNGTAIPAGDTVWFNAVLKPALPKNVGSVTIEFFNQSITSSKFSLSPPNSTVTFTTNVTCASTTYGSGGWTTTAPLSGVAGNTFLSAFPYVVPSGGLPGGLKSVTWSGTFTSVTPGVTLQWQWGAAVYTAFGASPGVKSTDDAKSDCTYNNNSDHAGTPENYKSSVVAGAMGGGGSNWTGGLSGTETVAPCE